MWYSGILIHTPSVGRNRRICDIRTHSARCFAHYTNEQRYLAYSQFSGVYIINNPCERYGGFMCTLRLHGTVHLFISSPPLFIYSISHTAYCRLFLQTKMPMLRLQLLPTAQPFPVRRYIFRTFLFVLRSALG